MLYTYKCSYSYLMLLGLVVISWVSCQADINPTFTSVNIRTNMILRVLNSKPEPYQDVSVSIISTKHQQNQATMIDTVRIK